MPMTNVQDFRKELKKPQSEFRDTEAFKTKNARNSFKSKGRCYLEFTLQARRKNLIEKAYGLLSVNYLVLYTCKSTKNKDGALFLRSQRMQIEGKCLRFLELDFTFNMETISKNSLQTIKIKKHWKQKLLCCKYKIYYLIEIFLVEININLGLMHILNAYFASIFYKVNDENTSGVRSKNVEHQKL